MKKLLSIVLAGAMILSVMTSALATVDSYIDSHYFDYDYDVIAEEKGINFGADLQNEVNSAEAVWELGTGATLKLVDDPVMGKVAELKHGSTDTMFRLKTGCYLTPRSDIGNSARERMHSDIEFNFKEEPGSAKWSIHMKDIIWGSGDSVEFNNGQGKMRNGTTFTYEPGKWTNIRLLQMKKTLYSGDFNSESLYVNNVLVSTHVYAVADAKADYDKASWTDSGIVFTAGEGTILFDSIERYASKNIWGDYADHNTDATGNKSATVTANGTDVFMSGTEISYNSGTVTTVADLKAGLTVTNGSVGVIAAAEGDEFRLEDTDDLYLDGEYEAKTLVAYSVSGDRVDYYSLKRVAPANVPVTFDAKLNADMSARTIKFSEAEVATVADFKNLINDNGGVVEVYAGDSLADDAAAASTITSVKAYDADKTVCHTYAVSCRPVNKTYIEMNMADFTGAAGDSARAFILEKFGTNRAFSTSATAVYDAELGYNVAKISGDKIIDMFDMPHDLVLGDKVVIEATIKPVTTSSKPSFKYSGNHYAFELDANAIKSHSGSVSYDPEKWYHIVTEFTPGEASGSSYTYVNGAQGGSSWPSTGQIINTIQAFEDRENNANGYYRLMASGDFLLASLRIYRKTTSYDPTNADDSVVLTSTNSGVAVDENAKVITCADAAMAATQFKAAFATNAEIVLLDASGAAVAENATVADAKTVLVRSASGRRVGSYQIGFIDVVSDVYTVAGDKISGVLPYTTPEQFIANVDFESKNEEGGYELTSGKYVKNGDKLYTSNGEYTIALNNGFANNGAIMVAGDGFFYGDMSVKPVVATDAMKGAGNDVLKIALNNVTTDAWGSFARIQFPGATTSTTDGNNGAGVPHLNKGESVNFEFSFKADGAVKGGAIMDSNYVFYVLDDGTLGVGQNASIKIPEKYNAGEWMHVAVSLTNLDEYEAGIANIDGGRIHEKLYLNGELVYSGYTEANNHGDSSVLELQAVADGVSLYYDDFKYYRTANQVFDAEFAYGDFDIISNDNNVVVGTNEVWLANGAKVTDGIAKTLYKADGTVAADADLTAGKEIFVKDATSTIIKKYAVKDGAFGIALDGSMLTANVGMIEEAAGVTVYVAGMNGSKFNTIKSVKKAQKYDDTITFDLTTLGADEAKVYVWDSSLRSLADVAEFVCEGGIWSAK